MGSFFKTCGKGLLAIVSSPLWILLFAIYVVYELLLMVFSPIRVLMSLLRHKKYTLKTDYDRIAQQIIDEGGVKNNNAPVINPQPVYQAPQPQPVYQNQQTFYNQPNFNQPPYPPNYSYPPNNQYPQNNYPQNTQIPQNNQYPNQQYNPYDPNNFNGGGRWILSP